MASEGEGRHLIYLYILSDGESMIRTGAETLYGGGGDPWDGQPHMQQFRRQKIQQGYCGMYIPLCDDELRFV